MKINFSLFQKFAALYMVLAGCLALALVMGGCTQKTVLTGHSDRAQEVAVPSPPPVSVITMHVWFVKEKDGNLEYVSVDRNTARTDSIYDAVSELLKGPSEQETKDGLSSEVPKRTSIIDVNDSNKEQIVLNLSKEFASDSGTDSLEARLEQLRRTVSEMAEGKKVFLDVDGNRLSEAGGEGLEIKQPINM